LTIDYEISLIDSVISDLINNKFDYDKIGRTVGGQYSLVAARTYYSGNNKSKVDLYSRAMAIGSSLALIYNPSLAQKSAAGPVIAIGGVAYYDFSLAEISSNPEKDIFMMLGRYLLKQSLEPYWVSDSYGGYYKSISVYGGQPLVGPLAFEQGMPLMAGAKLWKLDSTSQTWILNKMRKAVATHNILWDTVNYGYKEAAVGAARSVKMLSSNHLILRGLISLYDGMRTSYPREASWLLNKAKFTANFITTKLYGGQYKGYFEHDNVSDRYCTGCNFATLDDLNLLSGY